MPKSTNLGMVLFLIRSVCLLHEGALHANPQKKDFTATTIRPITEWVEVPEVGARGDRDLEQIGLGLGQMGEEVEEVGHDVPVPVVDGALHVDGLDVGTEADQQLQYLELTSYDRTSARAVHQSWSQPLTPPQSTTAGGEGGLLTNLTARSSGW